MSYKVRFETGEDVELPDFIAEHIDGKPRSAFVGTLDGELHLFVRYVDKKGRSHLKPFRWGWEES